MKQTKEAREAAKKERAEARAKQKRTLLRILKEAKPIRGWLIVAASVSLLSVILVLIGPELLGKLTDVIYSFWADQTPIDMGAFGRKCLILGGLYLISGACSLATMFIMNNVVSRHFTCAMRIRMSDKIRFLPVKYVDDTPNGEVISRMTNDVSMLGNTVHNFLEISISGVLKLIGIMIIVFTIQPIMALAVVILVPLSLVLSSLIAGRSEKHFADYRKTTGKIYALNEEDFSGFATVKAFNLEERQKREHEKLCFEAYGQA